MLVVAEHRKVNICPVLSTIRLSAAETESDTGLTDAATAAAVEAEVVADCAPTAPLPEPTSPPAVDLDAALEVLGGGLAGSKVLEQKKQNMLTDSFEPGFRIALHHKDMGIVTSAAREAGVVVPVAALVAQLMASALANGDGGLDHSGLLRGVERLSGTPTTSTEKDKQ